MEKNEIEEVAEEYGLPVLKKRYSDDGECHEHVYERVDVKKSERGFKRIDLECKNCGKRDFRFENHMK